MKTVYTCFDTDVIHEGHLELIRQASAVGELTVGALSDRALMSCGGFSTLGEKERALMYSGLEGVGRLCIQDDIFYGGEIERYRPDVVIHAEGWRIPAVREQALRALEHYGGTLMEIPRLSSESIRRAEGAMRDRLSMPEFRRRRLRAQLKALPIVRVIEAHNGLTGLIAEKTSVAAAEGLRQFDAMWISSLCDSAARGKPDIALVDMTARAGTVTEITEVTTKPVILDCDNGGAPEHLPYNIRTLERLGVSAVMIEDKEGAKKNSLFGVRHGQTQADREDFCRKIAAGKEAQLTEDFMLIARVESLILEKGMEDALERAQSYVRAGADGIMIHSRRKDPGEILDFCKRFRERCPDTPLVAVPSSYSGVTEEQLSACGVNMVIYANQLIRSAFPAMQQTAEEILRFHRAKESEERLMPISDIITLIDTI